MNLGFQWVTGSAFHCSACHKGAFGRLLVITIYSKVDGELVSRHAGPFCEQCLALYDVHVLLEKSAEIEEKANRAPSRKTRKISQQQERSFAEAHGARATAGSGSLHEKGDVRQRGLWRCECKTTARKSFSLTRKILDKIYGECELGEFPAVDIQYTDRAGRVQDRWVAIPFSKFEELCKD